MTLFGCFIFVFLSGAAFNPLSRRHLDTVFAVGCKHTMEPGQVDPWFGNQGRQLGNEIQRPTYRDTKTRRYRALGKRASAEIAE